MWLGDFNQAKNKRAKLADIDMDNFDNSSDDETSMTSMSMSSLEGIQKSLSLLASQPRTKENPFLSPGVLRSLMRNVEFPTEVKVLRPMCDAWNEVAVEELENRAFQGSIKPIYLHLGLDPKASTHAEKFFEDTQANPSLYQSFHLRYPIFLQVKDIDDSFERFFAYYTPSYLLLEVNDSTKEYGLRNKSIHLLITFLNRICSSLRELQISYSNTPVKLGKASMPDLDRYPLDKFSILQKLVLVGDEAAALFRKILNVIELSAPNLTALEVDMMDTQELSMCRFFGQDFRRESSILTRLTHLDIGSGGLDLSMLERSSWILLLSRSGMKLKYFSMQIDFNFEYDEEEEEEDEKSNYFPEEVHQICLNLTVFFKIQADSLEELSLSFKIQSEYGFETNDVESLDIQLPVFKNLCRLEILNSCEVEDDPEIFVSPWAFDSYSVNFPELEELKILTWEDIRKLGNGKNPPHLVLKRLKVSEGQRDKIPRSIWEERDYLMHDVSEVEILEVCADFFTQDGTELPWIKSLKALHIYKIDKALKLRHLKNLKTLVIEDDGQKLTEWGEFDNFIEFFLHIRRLKLDLIKFRGFKMSEKIRDAIVAHFPFQVEVVEKPIIWNEYDI